MREWRSAMCCSAFGAVLVSRMLSNLRFVQEPMGRKRQTMLDSSSAAKDCAATSLSSCSPGAGKYGCFRDHNTSRTPPSIDATLAHCAFDNPRKIFGLMRTNSTKKRAPPAHIRYSPVIWPILMDAPGRLRRQRMKKMISPPISSKIGVGNTFCVVGTIP